ncbi:MAG: hypothetical protein QW821_05420 [Candidatus Bathyarchaeia archaeon]
MESSKKHILGNLLRATQQMESARKELREAIKQIIELKEKADDLANDTMKLLSDLTDLEAQGVTN